MEQTVTAKIQIKTDKQTTELLEQSMSIYMQSCNFVAEYVYNTHQLKQIPLQKAVYEDLRNQFGLMSQMACNVPRTVIAKFKTAKQTLENGLNLSLRSLFLLCLLIVITL